jgi:CDP-diacylglycerol--glycerol-3-phosphate 3-phosphatidyltransferase
LVPVFALMYFDNQKYAAQRAVLVYVVAAVTDVLDGYIARKYNKITRLGRVLDPLADKLMAFTVLVCITIDQLIPPWAVATFFVKEALMGIGALLLYKKISDTPPSNVFGKISTVVFFAVCVILIICKDENGGSYLPEPLPAILIAAAIVIMLFAFASYLAKFIAVNQTHKSENDNN